MTLKQLIKELRQLESQLSYHASNCMIYAGSCCDCGESEREDRIQELKKLIDKKVGIDG